MSRFPRPGAGGAGYRCCAADRFSQQPLETDSLLVVAGSLALTVICTAVVAWLTAIVCQGLSSRRSTEPARVWGAERLCIYRSHSAGATAPVQDIFEPLFTGSQVDRQKMPATVSRCLTLSPSSFPTSAARVTVEIPLRAVSEVNDGAPRRDRLPRDAP